MNYELKEAKAQGLPFEKKEDTYNPESPLIYGINVYITTGIVGQTYAGFNKSDIAFCPILKTDTIDQILVKIDAFALAFIAATYPNT